MVKKTSSCYHVMKAGIIICNNKDSKRDPGKNGRLYCFTADWLKREAEAITKKTDFEIQIIETRSQQDMPGGVESFNLCKNAEWTIVSADICDLHCDAVREAMKHLKNSDVVALLQLSNPVRRPGLLFDAVNLAAVSNRVVTSCVLDYTDDWRRVRSDKAIGIRSYEKVMKIDGAMYAWKPDDVTVYEVFQPLAPKEWVLNYEGEVVDIDWRYQENPVLFESMNQHFIYEYDFWND